MNGNQAMQYLGLPRHYHRFIKQLPNWPKPVAEAKPGRWGVTYNPDDIIKFKDQNPDYRKAVLKLINEHMHGEKAQKNKTGNHKGLQLYGDGVPVLVKAFVRGIPLNSIPRANT